MRFSMIKERPFFFLPAAPVGICARIAADCTEAQLTAAVTQAMNAQGLMKTRVVLSKDGTAAYEPTEAAVVVLKPFEGDFAQLLRQEESYVFDLEHGEYVRFFFRMEEHSVVLAALLHQLIADCTGAALLMEDITRILSGGTVEAHPVQLYEPSWLPKGTSMPLGTRLSNKLGSMRWNKLKKSFSWEDRARLADRYWGWGTHATSFASDTLSAEDSARLQAKAREQGVSVSAAVTAALVYATGQSQKLRWGDTVRPEDCTGLGNFDVTYAFEFTYDPMTTLWNNAYAIEQQLSDRQNTPLLRYNQLLLIDQLPPTAVDSVYFAAYDGYKEPLANGYAHMFGLTQEPAGIAVTGCASSSDGALIAAPVPSSCVFAAAVCSCPDGLTVTLRTELDGDLNWLHDAMQTLREACADMD
ncbi:MAG: hypothetical protein IJY28_02990 [Clostridia bacterium]|nr:hypothetical protein [Clostridia bacterium]